MTLEAFKDSGQLGSVVVDGPQDLVPSSWRGRDRRPDHDVYVEDFENWATCSGVRVGPPGSWATLRFARTDLPFHSAPDT